MLNLKSEVIETKNKSMDGSGGTATGSLDLDLCFI